jgi:hypothetical protein
MQDLLKGARYVLASAANWQRAQKFMGAMVFPVILYDRLFDIADWRLAIRRLASSCGSPSVLLQSQTRDNQLRDELIGIGGFDVLLRPLEFDILSILDLATAHFTLPTPRLQPGVPSLVDLQATRQDQPGVDSGLPLLTHRLPESGAI